VVQSLEASWAFHDAGTFEEALLKAVNLGDDADTTGAICGQLAPAYWGESNTAASLRCGLARVDMLENGWLAFSGTGKEGHPRDILYSSRVPFSSGTLLGHLWWKQIEGFFRFPNQQAPGMVEIQRGDESAAGGGSAHHDMALPDEMVFRSVRD
jgi:hypothetical protein